MSHRFLIGSSAALASQLRAMGETSDPCVALNMAIAAAVIGPAQETLKSRIEGMMANDAFNGVINASVGMLFSLSCTVTDSLVDDDESFARLLGDCQRAAQRCLAAVWDAQIKAAIAARAARAKEPTVTMTCGLAGTHPGETKS